MNNHGAEHAGVSVQIILQHLEDIHLDFSINIGLNLWQMDSSLLYHSVLTISAPLLHKRWHCFLQRKLRVQGGALKRAE